MKKVVLLLLLSIPLFVFAQLSVDQVVPDERLVEAYGQQYIDKLLEDNPFLVRRWNYYLDHAYMIKDEVSGKSNDQPVISIDNFDHINILKLEKEQLLKRDWNKPVIYRIKGTGKMLIYHSGKDFNEAFKAYLAKED